jgi:hypothetical protein
VRLQPLPPHQGAQAASHDAGDGCALEVEAAFAGARQAKSNEGQGAAAAEQEQAVCAAAALQLLRCVLESALRKLEPEDRRGLHASSPMYCQRKVLYGMRGEAREPIKGRSLICDSPRPRQGLFHLPRLAL